MFLVVPNSLRDAINAKLDAAISACPGSEVDRQDFYNVLLAYYNDNGVLPEFTLSKKEE